MESPDLNTRQYWQPEPTEELSHSAGAAGREQSEPRRARAGQSQELQRLLSPGDPASSVASGGGNSPAALQAKELGNLAVASTTNQADDVRSIADSGFEGPSSPLPHLDKVQRAFEPHDLSGVRAFRGGAARAASSAMGASAFAKGEQVAFGSEPNPETVAHEAAHVVQQRRGVSLTGGVGKPGDQYERNADAVAARVASGKSAADLLGTPTSGGADALQLKDNKKEEKSAHVAKIRKEANRWGIVRSHKKIFKDLKTVSPQERAEIGLSTLTCPAASSSTISVLSRSFFMEEKSGSSSECQYWFLISIPV